MIPRWPYAVAPLALANDEAHVWAVPLVVERLAWERLWATLTSCEIERAAEFYFDDPKRRFVIARGALRRLLSNYLNLQSADIDITLDQNGKPCLGARHNPNNLHFNVSHSGDLALIAIAPSEVGVDVEQLRDVGHLEQIARRFFHPLEIEAILATPAAERSKAFLRCWTGKEAVLKAFGAGITGSLTDFQVPFSGTGQGWIELPAVSQRDGRRRCWLQPLAPSDGYLAAVATVESEPTVRCWTLSM